MAGRQRWWRHPFTKRNRTLVAFVVAPLALGAVLAHHSGGADLAARAARDAGRHLERSRVPAYLPQFDGWHARSVTTDTGDRAHPAIDVVYASDDPLVLASFVFVIKAGTSASADQDAWVVDRRDDATLEVVGHVPGLSARQARRVLRHARPVDYDALAATAD